MRPAILYTFAGLPGCGKTTLSRSLAARVGAAHLRIDTIEQALRDLCSLDVEGEGYALAYRIAGDILSTDVSVVADSCNPVTSTRHAWEEVARNADAACVNIEIVCSDKEEHRRRVEQRRATVPGLRLPTWREVEARAYDEWTTGRIILDTAGRTVPECLQALADELRALSNSRNPR